jgi:hypothetical protein
MMGFLTFLGGLWGILTLIFEEVAKTERVPFRYYAMMVGLISGGLAMIGIGQGLRAAAAARWQAMTVTSRAFDFGHHEDRTPTVTHRREALASVR